MRARDAAGHHGAAGWRLLTVTAGFLVLMGAIANLIEARFYALMSLVSAPCAAFVGGYCFRQQILNTGTPPRFRFLWLKEDLQPDAFAEQDHVEPRFVPSPHEAVARRKRVWRRLLIVHGVVALAATVVAAVIGQAVIIFALVAYEILVLPLCFFALFNTESIDQ